MKRREVERAKQKAEAEELMKGEVKRESSKNIMKIRHDGGVSVSGIDSLLCSYCQML